MTDFKVEWQINMDKKDKNGIPLITRRPGCSIEVEQTDTITFNLTLIQYGLKLDIPVGRFAGYLTDLAKTKEAQERHETYGDVEVTDLKTKVKRCMKYIPGVKA